DSSSTQYQLLRSPRSNPTVNFCCEIFLLGFAAMVLTFFIAGLLFICASSTSITWERTPHPVRRPAFSSLFLRGASQLLCFLLICFGRVGIRRFRQHRGRGQQNHVNRGFWHPTTLPSRLCIRT